MTITGEAMKDNIALVTGANGGLGTSVTQALLDAGATKPRGYIRFRSGKMKTVRARSDSRVSGR
jgi:nucleoside-diphosphate-sugar epimerase